jgi:membrane associated rhomboid family serine protease
MDAPPVITADTREDGRSRSLWRRLTRRPITHAMIVVAVLWTAILLTAPYERWRSLGVSGGFEVFSGDYWSLFTSSFAHANLIHLFFNIYWLAILGGYTEERFGRRFYALLIVICTFCSSSLELCIAGETGIGLSGVVYGIFGFLWGTKLFGKQQHPVLDAKTIQLFLIWLFLCIALSATGTMAIGNVAHFSGLIVGILIALVCLKQSLIVKSLLPAIIIVSAGTLFYSPWSEPWLQSRAFKAHSKGDYRLAEEYYTRLLSRDPDDDWVLENRAEVREELGKVKEALEDKQRAEHLRTKKK